MFIIPVAGMAKAMMVVTISLHPGAHQGPASYTVQQGDTLSVIAAHAYGNAADWPAVWWANRRQVPNPNVIAAGQRLRLPASGQVPTLMARAAQAAIPARPPPRPRPLPRRSLPRLRLPRAGPTGRPSQRVSPAGTGAPTPATASTAGSSSASRPGLATVAASTPRRPTWLLPPSRLPWPSGCWLARASVPGLYAGQAAKTNLASPACTRYKSPGQAGDVVPATR